MYARWLARIGFAGALLTSINAIGQGNVHVTQELEGWQDWVLHGHEYRRCPFRYDSEAREPGDFICTWPGRLEVNVDAKAGLFVQRWTIFGKQQWVPLPGDESVWPLEVSVDGRATSPVLRHEAPHILLAPGNYRVAGAFAWASRPATLAIPQRTGPVVLVVDGQAVALPQRSEDGLWLDDDRDRAQQEDDAITVHVYRRIQDDVPTLLETVFELRVAGSVREEQLSPALPSGFTALGLTSDLPARLEANGNLWVRVQPGSWRISLRARAATVLDAITMPQPDSNMPSTEIWSFEAKPELRTALPQAQRAVAPTLVGAPWSELPAFEMVPGEPLTIVERGRGQQGQNAGNVLHLARDLWLDFDGRGFVFADQVTGRMRTGWRLDVSPPYALLAASEHGNALLVTRNGAEAGVELRKADLGVDALGRIESRGEIPVAGWQADLAQMEARLNLPPGDKLLAAVGADDAPASWAGRWRLLDFFLVLIITVAVARLFGRATAAVTLVALTLSFHEPGAPVWTWLNLLAAAALARVAPAGRLRRLALAYRIVSFALLLALLVPFAVAQIRIAIYPQLEPEAHRRGEGIGMFQLLSGQLTHDVPREHEGELARAAELGTAVFERALPDVIMVNANVVQDDGTASLTVAPRDGALLPVGPGRPDWEWTTYQLSWSGPVDAEQTMRLLILPAPLTAVLRILALAGLGLLAARLAFDILGRDWRWPQLRRASGTAVVVAVALLAVSGNQPAHAQPPSQELLNELRERLLAPPPCTPWCAQIVSADVAVGEREAVISLDVHALAQVAVPIPGAADGWQPAEALVGNVALAVQPDADGTLQATLASGRHTVTLRGPLPLADTVEIAFPAAPRRITVQSEHWFVDGVDDGTLPSGALALTRLRSGANDEMAAATWEAGLFPAFVTVRRMIRLDLDWDVQTTVERIAPATGAINLAVPLLDSESVLTQDRSLEAGRLQVAMSPTQQRFSWSSSLSPSTTMTLRAPEDQPWREVWEFHIGNRWRVSFDGVAESTQDDANGLRVFWPRPGETLAVAFTRPETIPGNTLAFDNVHLKTSVGARLRDSRLALNYRSTRGTSHRIVLPDDARLKTVTIDGRQERLELADGALNLPIAPGNHRVEVTWDEASPAGLRVVTPDVQLGAPSSNIISSLAMPTRWLLFATGPDMGPAILYWSELVALIIVSLILGRIALTPLRTHHWLLLGLGFSTFSWLAFGVVAAWLFAHGARVAWGTAWKRRSYNLSQLAFGLLTLAAFAAILIGIRSGLLGNPDMSVAGFQSSAAQLSWFADQTHNAIPKAAAFSLPMWIYKALILAWALWFTFALIRWLPWIWRCFAERGLWQAAPPPAEPEPVQETAPQPPTDDEDPWQR